MNDFTETAPSLSLEWPITAQDSAHLAYSRGYTYIIIRVLITRQS